MADSNPYAAPTAQLVDVAVAPNTDATRGARLGAVIIDGLISFALLGPVMYATGYWGRAMARAQAGEYFSLEQLLFIAGGFAAFAAIQFVPLSQTGQTWGKRLLKIKIVALDGTKPPVGSLLLMRFLPMQLAPNIPVIGSILSLIDICFIFGKEKRTVHDRIAGTKVVNA